MKMIFRKLSFSLGVLAYTLAIGQPQREILLPVPEKDTIQGDRTVAGAMAQGIHFRKIDSVALLGSKPKDTFTVTLPDGVQYVLEHDRTETHQRGEKTWIGHVQASDSGTYRAFITLGRTTEIGWIDTPKGAYQIKPVAGRPALIDTTAAKYRALPMDEGGLPPPAQKKELRHPQKSNALASAVVTSSPSSVIDVAIFYTPEFVSANGSDASALTRINHLISVGNQAFIDSGIKASLRLVHTELVYPVSNKSSLDLLQSLATEENAILATYSDPALSGIARTRNRVGADLVSLIRPLDSYVDITTCGLTWVGGYDLDLTGLIMGDYKSLAYSVVNDGNDIRSSGYYCEDTTLVHEFGHNLGSAHDISHSATPGAYSFSYGYGQDGIFGTIMSYISPRVAKFSTPAQICNGWQCGVDGSADNVRSINNLRTTIASYRATAILPGVTPQNGWWWNASEPGRGYFIEKANNRFFIGSYLYENAGSPVWYVTGPGEVSSSTASGQLGGYHGGQTLEGVWKSPTGPVSAGSFSVTFSDPTHGTITWPGGSTPVVRYEIANGSLSTPAPAFIPETGWWWNASEGGRGWSIEVQGEYMFMAGFMYNDAGNPIWYVSGGLMTTPYYYSGTLQQCSGGMPLTGGFRTATCTTLPHGSVALSFSSRTTANLRLPSGQEVSLTRFTF